MGLRRRTVLATGASTLAGLAGCLGGGSDSLPRDDDPDDGRPPPEAVEEPPPTDADPTGFETIERDGESVRLAPADVVYAWYANRDARVVDARGTTQYEKSHVYGAVSSPAAMLEGAGAPDPVTDWPSDARIVTYCGCPHHISSRRAATLQTAGYRNVFVLDEGFWAGWHDRGYPTAGSDASSAPQQRIVEGVVDPANAGATAVLVHPASGQREEAPVGSDGRYRLRLRFYGVDADATVALRTPEYEVAAPLGALTRGVVTGRDRLGTT